MVTVQREALVVEDDDAIREVLRDLLEGAGFTVREATDGMDAFTILHNTERGLLVLLDYLLPGMDGGDVLAALESDAGAEVSAGDATRPVLRHAYVLLTASPQKITPEMAERLARLGAPIVAKPFDLATLAGAVDEATHRLWP